ncbi:hypothetical protein NE237_026670 [Protea cynaroides]|uniref:Uncharacterized protein n=1 Tax=Protea cynaroides TaxID=273540 RepID=A0A9Q0H9E1_9MAGN|nr:hypothetical protein NE237_026670 [Protea cynaroides]
MIEENFQGHGYVAQLQIVFPELTRSGHVSFTVEDLVSKISRSFMEALSPFSGSEFGEVLANFNYQRDDLLPPFWFWNSSLCFYQYSYSSGIEALESQRLGERRYGTVIEAGNHIVCLKNQKS